VRESLQGSPFNNVPTCFLHSELAAENTRIELRPGCSALHQQAFEKIHRETRKVGNQPVISIEATNPLFLSIGADGANSPSGGIRIPTENLKKAGRKNRGKIPSLWNAQRNSSQ
jgi:hypothetical protein